MDVAAVVKLDRRLASLGVDLKLLVSSNVDGSEQPEMQESIEFQAPVEVPTPESQ